MKKISILIFLVFLLILTALIACLCGATKNYDAQILWQIRFPRMLLGLMIGAGLSSSGAVMQGLVHNPLAEPYTLGISGGAALGAAIAMLLGLNSLYISLLAFAGALFCMILIFSFASLKKFSNHSLILCGVMLNFFLSSCIMIIFSLAKSTYVHTSLVWLMGDLSMPEINLIKIAMPLILGFICILWFFSKELNILCLGEEKALHLGINVKWIKKIFFICISLIVGLCVSLGGVIGFVGLVIPHIIRITTGCADYRFLIPASAIGGAIFLILCDTLARTILSPIELPVGVVTGIIGGIFFFILFFKQDDL